MRQEAGAGGDGIMTYKIKTKKIKAWADVGSHGGIFVFEVGPVAQEYPSLLHIYKRKISKDLVPVTITYEMS